MNKDITYCINKDCDKKYKCKRYITQDKISDYTWLFGGCTDNDEFYLIPKEDY